MGPFHNNAHVTLGLGHGEDALIHCDCGRAAKLVFWLNSLAEY